MARLTELEMAEAIASGELPSPQRIANSWLVPMRISGTGVAWRPSEREFVFRDPKIWLTPKMCRRCAAMPVIVEHPEAVFLGGEDYRNRVVGGVIHAYVGGENDDELWGIARLFAPALCQLIAEGEMDFDTSPAVALHASDQTIELPGGDKMLIESEPMLLDPLAVVPRGVWSKGDSENLGIQKEAA